LKTICDARIGKTVPLVRVFCTISLEYWLRDLAIRGLLDASVVAQSRFGQGAVPVNA